MNKIELKEIVENQRKINKEDNIIEREVSVKLSKWEKNPFTIIISGIRRCGKSTLLNQIRKTQEGYYLNFDDDRLVNFTVEDFQKLDEIFMELYGKKNTYFFDEIQNIEKWELFVRRLRDENKKVYVTGSNATMLSKELGTRLTGRYLQLTLFPFSFREFLIFKKIEYSRKDLLTTEGKARIKKALNEFLRKGGIPEYIRTENVDYLRILYDNIIYRDILVRYRLTNERVMKELVHYISSNISKEVSFNSLKKTLGLGSATTVKEYFDYLQNSFLVFLVPKYSNSLKKQIQSNKKVYFIDNALVLNIGYRLSQDLGRILENTVFIELKRRGNDIYYHRGKKECDFILKDKREAIQVCYDLDENNKKREIDGLLEAMNEFKLKQGLILTYDQEEKIKINNKQIKVKPVWKWLLE